MTKEKPDKEVQGNGQQPDSNTDQENQNENHLSNAC